MWPSVLPALCLSVLSELAFLSLCLISLIIPCINLFSSLLFLPLSNKWQRKIHWLKEQYSQSKATNALLIGFVTETEPLKPPLLSRLLLRDDIFWAPSQVQVWCYHKYSIEFEILGSVRTQNAALSVQLCWNHNTTSGWSGVLFPWT